MKTLYKRAAKSINSLVNDRVFQDETAKVSVSRYEQQKMFPKWSKDFPEVKAVHSQVLQNVAVRADLAFRAFFQRVKEGKTPGFPRLKGKGQYDSITYPQSGSCASRWHRKTISCQCPKKPLV